jgi:D-glutamate N-acetyltransferase
MLVLRKPYLLYLGDATLKSDCKTAFGLRDWCRDAVLAEWSHPAGTVTLGLERLSPRAAAARGAGSIIVGVAPTGGSLPERWLDDLAQALEAGLDAVSGMHTRLGTFPRLVAAAERGGGQLVDVRNPGSAFPVATGRKRSGLRVLTVGTDCALGKKYTALALTRALAARAVAASFRATGQTGIMIAGEGIPMDAVVSDFLAGAAEQLSPDNAAGHWDVIEGQGSLLHPAYAAVTLGLLHGSQPDAIVLCHDPERRAIEEYPDYPIPPLGEVIDLYLRAGRLTNPRIRCVGLSINSSALDEAAWHAYRTRTAAELGLAVCDPLRGGVEPLADALLAR